MYLTDDYFRYCSARLERKDFHVETTKEKIDKLVRGVLTKILRSKNKSKKDKHHDST